MIVGMIYLRMSLRFLTTALNVCTVAGNFRETDKKMRQLTDSKTARHVCKKGVRSMLSKSLT